MTDLHKLNIFIESVSILNETMSYDVETAIALVEDCIENSEPSDRMVDIVLSMNESVDAEKFFDILNSEIRNRITESDIVQEQLSAFGTVRKNERERKFMYEELTISELNTDTKFKELRNSLIHYVNERNEQLNQTLQD